MRRLASAVAVFALSFFELSAGPVRPEVPDNLKAPAGEDVMLMAHATGVQIYACQVESSQKSVWVLKGPEADLKDDSGKLVAHHFAGPTWKDVDGSEVVGKLVAKQDAPKPGAIPWLLLSAASHTGDGMMSRVATIQRIHTDGGLPPNASECNAAAKDKESRSSYSADYYFYAPAPK
jgi:Protein of unknown function (DUF3455)